MERTSSRRLRATMDSVLIHDLKNVGQRLALLLANMEEHWRDPDFHRGEVELLTATVERIDAIVQRVAGHEDAVLVKVPLDLNDLLREVARKARGRGVSGARVVTATGELARVWGDTNFLADALASVVQNALEAAGPSGTVTLRTRMARVGRRARAVIEVEDDGAGMPEEFVRERLFRPFQTTKPDGVGLGLYTARQIVALHGGAIEVESRPGRGTRVSISLPAAPAAEARA